MGNNSIAKMIFLISQIGITMLTTIFLCIGLGYAVDEFFGVNLTVWFIVLGVLAGFKSVSILLKKFLGDLKPTDNDVYVGSNQQLNMDREHESDEDDWKDM